MGPFGSSIRVETFVEEPGIPVISGQHLHGFRLDPAPGFNYLTEEHADQLGRTNVFPGDVIFTHAGNIKNVAYIPENAPFSRFVVSQRQFFVRPDRQVILPEFLTYFFRGPIGQHRLLANSAQTGVPSIAQPVSYIRTVKVPVPTLLEQRNIVATLGALDDKIESNSNAQELLHQLNRADFDRTVRFESTVSLGFDEVVERLNVKATSKEHISSTGKYSVFDQGASGLLGYSDMKPAVEASVVSPILLFGDHTCTLKLVTEPCHLGPNLIAFVPNSESDINPIWLYFALLGKQNFQEYRRHWMELRQHSIVRVSKKAEDGFVRTVRSRLELSSSLAVQNRLLEALRDSLLPELLSGRIRVGEAAA